jgi:outer membrane protein assembly factor BamE (lipoprotein component of BamABCDE complex)
VYVPGFGLVFRFYFAPDLLKSPWGYDTVIAEINKYLLPEAEYRTQHAALEEAAKKVEIQPGMTREQVIKALGEPLKTIVFGNKTILKYQDITVELVENKVVEVKVN